MNANDLGVVTAGRFARKCAEAGWEIQEFEDISVDDLVDLRSILRGQAEVKPAEHAFDRGVLPKPPINGATIAEHHGTAGISKFERKEDGLYLNGGKVTFYLSKGQESGPVTDRGHRHLSKRRALSATDLDYLLEHPNLIPQDWKRDKNGSIQHIFFWGTVFHGPGNNLCVRTLLWNGGQWQSSYHWLGSMALGSDCPAAVLAG
jgi:hypothetical protein